MLSSAPLVRACTWLALSGSLGLSRPAAAQAPASGASAPADSLALSPRLATAQRTLVASFATGDTTASAPLWCPDYRAIGGTYDHLRPPAVSRDSVLRQFGPANQRQRPAYRFAPVLQDDTAGLPEVRFRTDTTALVVGQYWQDRVGSPVYDARLVTVQHEFRRRPGGWCAVFGVTAVRPQ